MNLILDFTRVCNSRCTTCNIWREKDPVTLDLAVIEKLFSQIPAYSLADVFVTGGEPYINPIVVDIARLLHRYHPGARWSGATNCISPKTEETIARIASIVPMGYVTLSLEGDEAQHDKTRGVVGNYRRVMAVRDFLEASGLPYMFSTVTDEGEAEGYRLKVFTDKNHARTGKRFGNEGDNFLYKIRDCPGGSGIVVVNPYGEVSACEVDDMPELYLGNIITQDWADMRWEEVQGFVRSGSCPPCSMSCWFPPDV